MKRFERIVWVFVVITLLAGFIWSSGRAWLADRRADAAQEVASSALDAVGFQSAKIVSRWRLNKIVDSRQNTVDSIKETGLHVAAVEKAKATLKTRVGAKPIIPDAEGELAKVTVGCLFIPWTDGRLTIEKYDPPTNALTYSLRQQFRLIGTYLADERGTIRFGKLELYEVGVSSQRSGIREHPSPDAYSLTPEVIGTAEITDYELLATKPLLTKWRLSFGVKAGAELDFNGDLNGVLAGVEIGLNRLGIFGFLNLPTRSSSDNEPTLLVGAGWKW